MRVLHTADWHLGRIFHGVHLTEDQAYTLDGLCKVAKETRPDVVIIAGDLYDRAVPPPDAVSLLDETLAQLVIEVGCTVMLIAGNHDSPERLGFGGRLLQHARVHVAGPLHCPLIRIPVDDKWGTVWFHLLPFAEPGAVRLAFGGQPPVPGAPAVAHVEGHGAAMTHLVKRAAANVKPDERHVVIAHGSVANAEESESERPLFIGTHGAADASIFAPFVYTALGHHHRPQDLGPQALGAMRVRYPGSLLAYSFAEKHQPSVSLVDMDEKGTLTREVIPLPVRHDVEVRRGTMQELMAQTSSNAYLKLILTDAGPVLDPLARLRERYPNALMLEQERLTPRGEGRVVQDIVRIDDEALFARFFEEMVGTAPSGEERSAFREIVAMVDLREREGQPVSGDAETLHQVDENRAVDDETEADEASETEQADDLVDSADGSADEIDDAAVGMSS